MRPRRLLRLIHLKCAQIELAECASLGEPSKPVLLISTRQLCAIRRPWVCSRRRAFRLIVSPMRTTFRSLDAPSRWVSRWTFADDFASIQHPWRARKPPPEALIKALARAPQKTSNRTFRPGQLSARDKLVFLARCSSCCPILDVAIRVLSEPSLRSCPRQQLSLNVR